MLETSFKRFQTLSTAILNVLISLVVCGVRPHIMSRVQKRVSGSSAVNGKSLFDNFPERSRKGRKGIVFFFLLQRSIYIFFFIYTKVGKPSFGLRGIKSAANFDSRQEIRNSTTEHSALRRRVKAFPFHMGGYRRYHLRTNKRSAVPLFNYCTRLS